METGYSGRIERFEQFADEFIRIIIDETAGDVLGQLEHTVSVRTGLR